jgi:hypothetical protein
MVVTRGEFTMTTEEIIARAIFARRLWANGFDGDQAGFEREWCARNQKDYFKDAQAALSALSSAGYEIVPREATDASCAAFYAWDSLIEREGSGDVRDMYRAMIQAATAPQKPAEGDSGT